MRCSTLWLLLLILVACQSSFAQTVVGRISGTVQDANGAVVPHASVKIINTANNSERTVTSDPVGRLVRSSEPNFELNVMPSVDAPEAYATTLLIPVNVTPE